MITRVNLAKEEEDKGSLSPVGIAVIISFLVVFISMAALKVYELSNGYVDQAWNPFYHLRRARNNANRIQLDVRV